MEAGPVGGRGGEPVQQPIGRRILGEGEERPLVAAVGQLQDPAVEIPGRAFVEDGVGRHPLQDIGGDDMRRERSPRTRSLLSVTAYAVD